MTGRLTAVVGPSGVGKDSVMAGMARAQPRLALVRRVITRAEDAGGEDFDGVDRATFDRMRDAGAFALWWAAHDMHYGIPVSVEEALASGQDCVANLSRGVLVQAQARFAHLQVISLVARPEVLAERLAARGRESRTQIAERLARAGSGLPSGIAAHEVDNSGALQDTVTTALARLYPVRA